MSEGTNFRARIMYRAYKLGVLVRESAVHRSYPE
jgi:hypothetical protein